MRSIDRENGGKAQKNDGLEWWMWERFPSLKNHTLLTYLTPAIFLSLLYVFIRHGAPRIPSTIDYDMTKAVIDLIEFAAIHLVPGGRLVFWLPTVTEEYTDLDIPAHPDLFLVASCEQSFGKWARRLITMEKRQRRQRVPGEDCNSDAAAPSAAVAGKQHIPAHANFRQVYFSSKNSSK